MKRLGRLVKAKSSGQLLIVAALAIAILISTTTAYVYEVSRQKPSVSQSFPLADFVLAIKQGSRNAIISALANITNGGEKAVLASNLNGLSQAYRSLNAYGLYYLSHSVLNDSRYVDGFRLSWEEPSGLGISSAYANFTLEFYGLTEKITLSYAINITTTIRLKGYCTLNASEKVVSLTCQVFNEEKPALAKNITVYYELDGIWVPTNSSNNLSIIDYGNGTYAISFTVSTDSDDVRVSVHVYDLRGIFVKANLTCDKA
ncbi:MAG: hypothetical protein QXH40_00455 [Candidatus Bathyarchaeia archaeon]